MFAYYCVLSALRNRSGLLYASPQLLTTVPASPEQLQVCVYRHKNTIIIRSTWKVYTSVIHQLCIVVYSSYCTGKYQMPTLKSMSMPQYCHHQQPCLYLNYNSVTALASNPAMAIANSGNTSDNIFHITPTNPFVALTGLYPGNAYNYTHC